MLKKDQLKTYTGRKTKKRDGPVLKNDQLKTYTGKNKIRDGPVLKNDQMKTYTGDVTNSRWSCA